MIQILVETGKFLELEIAVITIDALMKDMKRKTLHHLRENKFSSVHSSVQPSSHSHGCAKMTELWKNFQVVK